MLQSDYSQLRHLVPLCPSLQRSSARPTLFLTGRSSIGDTETRDEYETSLITFLFTAHQRAHE